MDCRIDLDLAVGEIVLRAERWRELGITVGAVTWRDQGDGWPPTIKTGDLEYWSGDPDAEPLCEAPGWDDWLTVATYGALLDRFAQLFA